MPDDTALPPLPPAAPPLAPPGGSGAPPGPGRDLGPGITYVRDLQRDGRLLLRFVARRTDRPLGSAALLGPTEPAGVAAAPHVLLDEPAAIAADHRRLEALAACVDQLSQRAGPATVATIRLTSAFLRVAPEGGEPPEEVIARGRKLRRMMSLIIGIAVLATIASVLLLAHVDDGRRAMQQLQEVRRDLATTNAELAKLPEGAWVGPGLAAAPPANGAAAPPRPFLPWCEPEEAGGRQPAHGEAGARAKALCSQLYEAALREALVFQRISAWNCRTHAVLSFGGLADRLAGVEPVPCGALPEAARKPMNSDGSDWRRTEIRTAGAISVLTGFVLPLLLGCVGGCAYALRRLDQKLSDWTLEVKDGSHSLLRVLLATMLGGLLGVVWSGEQPVQLGGFALTLAAAAFFVGFALEVVFSVIEAMVDGVAGKLRTPQPAAPPPARQAGTGLPGG
jgi:hypothetical protein